MKVQDSIHLSALVPSDETEKGYQSDGKNDENKSVAKDLLGRKAISNYPENITVAFVRIVKTRQIDESNIMSVQIE